jgi:hypothetical protein
MLSFAFFVFLNAALAADEVDCLPRQGGDASLSQQLRDVSKLLGGFVANAPPAAKAIQLEPAMECKPDSGGTRCRGLLPGSPYVTNLFFPADYVAQEKLDAAIFFHGDEFSKDAQGIFDGRAGYKFDFAAYANSSGNKGRVIIVPEQQSNKATTGAHFSALATGASFQAWMDSVAKTMQGAGLLKKAEVGKLALSGHSRAYSTLAVLAREKSDALNKVHSVAMLDGYNKFTWNGQELEASNLLPLYADRIKKNGGIFYANSVPKSLSSGGYELLKQRFGNPIEELNEQQVAKMRSGEKIPMENSRFIFQNFGNNHYTQVSNYYTSFLKTIP